MWWYEDSSAKKRKRRTKNKRRSTVRPVLMVNARMAEQRREWRRRAGTVMLVLVTLTLFFWLAVRGTQALGRVLFSDNDQFIIRHLELTSDDRLKPWHIREYADISEGMNLFDVDIEKVRQNLQSVPLVSRVRVQRKLPDTLVVEVAERMALARLGNTGRSFPLAVDREGCVLGPSSWRESLPAVTGLNNRGLRPGRFLQGAEMQDALKVLEICDTTPVGEYLKISRINIGHPEYLDVRLEQGQRVMLARKELGDRLARIAGMVQEDRASGRVASLIDATGENNFTATYR